MNDQPETIFKPDTSLTPDSATYAMPTSSPNDKKSCGCQQQSQGKERGEQLVYALGKLDVRFPSVGIEREFQQRERSLVASRSEQPTTRRGDRLRAVLKMNEHLARSVCFVLSVGGIPVYSVIPTSSNNANQLIDALARVDEPDGWDMVVGRAGQMSPPTECAGLLVQRVACDAFYSFTLGELIDQLVSQATPALKNTKGKSPGKTEDLARDFFMRVATSLENTGVLDTHRALNYLLVQHPGLYVAAIQRAETSILDSIETRTGLATVGRRVITVVLTFIDRVSGVPERLFTRVDVTEEWPFLADSLSGSVAPLGLAPFVEPTGSANLIM